MSVRHVKNSAADLLTLWLFKYCLLRGDVLGRVVGACSIAWLSAMEGMLADDWSQVHMLCKCRQEQFFKIEANFGNC